MRKPYPTDLSDAQWKYIEPHLPAPKGLGRPKTHDLREILNAIYEVVGEVAMTLINLRFKQAEALLKTIHTME